MNCGLLILHYQQSDYTIELLNSLFSHDNSNSDIHILDNGSTNDSLSLLEIHLKEYGFLSVVKNPFTESFETASRKVFIHHLPDNVGFSGGNNELRKRAGDNYDLLYFLNNDVIFTQNNTVDSFCKLFERHDDCFLAGCRVANTDGTLDSPMVVNDFWDDLIVSSAKSWLFRIMKGPSHYIDWKAVASHSPCVVGKVSGAAMIFRASSFDSLGGFDEQFWLSCEEIAWSKKIERASGKVYYLPNHLLVHKKAAFARAKNDREILRNHYLQRIKYYKNYESYGLLKLLLLRLSFTIKIWRA